MSADHAQGMDAALARADALLRATAHGAADGGARIAAMTGDLFLPDEHRLSDYQRAAMHGLLDRLIHTIEADLRAHLLALDEDHLSAAAMSALGSAETGITASLLGRTQLLREPDLVAVLLLRAEEQRIFKAARDQRLVDAQAPYSVEIWLGCPDAIVAAAAMAVLVAESRRFDALDTPIMARTDLIAELQVRLVWQIAAALAHCLVTRHAIAPARADAMLSDAARASLAMHDEGEALEAATMQLAGLIDGLGGLADPALAAAASEGRLCMVIAMIAARVGIDFSVARDLIANSGMRHFPVVLRAIGIARGEAATILLALDAGRHTDAALTEAMQAFDMIDEASAAEAIRPWRLDPLYRQTRAILLAQDGADE